MQYRGLGWPGGLVAIALLASCRTAPPPVRSSPAAVASQAADAAPPPALPILPVVVRDPLAAEDGPDLRFSAVDGAIAAAITAGKMPGCVLVVGRHDEVLLRRAYGSRALQPSPLPMMLDTVFDLASLTKPL